MPDICSQLSGMWVLMALSYLGFLSGTLSRRKSFREFQAQQLRIGKKIPVVETIPPQDLRDTEDDMSLGTFLSTWAQSHSPNSTTRF